MWGLSVCPDPADRCLPPFPKRPLSVQGHRQTRPHSHDVTQPLWLELALPPLKAGSSVRLKMFSFSLARSPSKNRVFGALEVHLATGLNHCRRWRFALRVVHTRGTRSLSSFVSWCLCLFLLSALLVYCACYLDNPFKAQLKGF